MPVPSSYDALRGLMKQEPPTAGGPLRTPRNRQLVPFEYDPQPSPRQALRTPPATLGLLPHSADAGPRPGPRWTPSSTAATLSLAGAGLGLAIRLTLKDELPLVAVLYYALPWPVVAALVALAALLWAHAGRGRAAAATALVAGAIALGWGADVRGLAVPRHEPGDLRAQFWNVNRLRGGRPLIESLRSEQADLIGIVEGRRGPRFWRSAFPELDVAYPGRGIVLAARGRIESATLARFGRRSSVASFDVRVDGEPLRVHVVDLESLLWSPRGPLLRRVADIVLAPSPAPVLVMGDFNTPIDSVWLGPLRHGLSNPFETARADPLPTWPSPFPFVAIDQVWLDPRLEVTAARRRLDVGLSDHARLVVSLRRAPPGRQAVRPGVHRANPGGAP
jgi:endonuclease/exonuclease/phosphatase (EEP) superfamily protein YafD